MGMEYIDKVLDSKTAFKLDHKHAETHVAIIYDRQFEAAKRDIDKLISSKKVSSTRKPNFLKPTSKISNSTYKSAAVRRKGTTS